MKNLLSRPFTAVRAYFILTVILFAVCTCAGARTWMYEFPDSAGGVAGLWPSIAIDSSGIVHVAYVGHSRLMHAYRMGSWSKETVNESAAAVGESARWTSIAVYGTTVHIAYQDARTGSLRHTWKDGSGWHLETVDSSANVGSHTCIAVNGSGYPAISYYDEDNNSLKYACKDGSGWHVSTIAAGCGIYNSLAFDASGSAHISYYDSNETLKHAWKTDGWNHETVDAGKYHGEMNSIAVSPSGSPHIAYRDGFRGVLMHAWKDASGWHTEVADPEDRTGFQCSIKIGTDGYPRIAHFRHAGFNANPVWYGMETRYSYKTASGWTSVMIQRLQTTNAQWGMSLALDNYNRPRVAYHYFHSKSLNYMYSNDNTNWTQETPDQGKEIGAYASVAIDPSGDPHISYQDMDNGDTRYVRKYGSVWSSSQIVDSSGDAGEYSSIQMLPGGYPAVAYVRQNANLSGNEYSIRPELKYAYRDGGGWHSSTVHTDAGNYCSLAVLSGMPAISYGDITWKGCNTRYAQLSGTWQYAVADYGDPPADPKIDYHVDGLFTDVAFDGSGNPHISYMETWEDLGSSQAYDDQRRRLMHAWRSGGIWYHEIVDDGQVGKYSSIAIDSSGYPRIAYQDVENANLKYAFKDASGWHIEIVDTAVATGFHISLALNPNGSPAIAYKDVTSQVLRYAWKDGSGWHIEPADYGGRTGDYASLAFTPSGSPYIVYMDWDNFNLKAAYPSPHEYGTISGWVRDTGGSPLGGAVVETNTGGYSTTSNPDGSYVLYDVDPGTYSVTASKPGYFSKTQTGVLVETDQTTTVNFSLMPVPAGTIRGYVKDDAGNPIYQASVSTSPGGYSTLTNASGSYTLSVPPNTYSVTASKDGYDPETAAGITVSSGGTATVNFNLSEATFGSITGWVRDTGGNPIGGAVVQTNSGGYSTASQSDGGYTLADVAAGSYNVTASADGYSSQTRFDIAVVGGQTEQVDFNLQPLNVNVVRNGSFENGFAGGVGVHWSGFQSDGYSPTFYDGTDYRVDGLHSQKIMVPQPVSEAYSGVYQVCATVPGGSYNLSAWKRAMMYGESYCGEFLVCKLGYDLTGGTDFRSGSIYWTEFNACKQTWYTLSRNITATGDKVTIFLEAWRKWPIGGDYAYAWFDNVSLTGPTTPPTTPVVTDEGDYQASTSSIHASWSASDENYAITEYQYAVSSSLSDAGIISGGEWQSTGTGTSATRTGLNLAPGGTYYVLVKAKNELGVWSAVGASDGIAVVQTVTSANAAKLLSDGSYVRLEGVVCSRRPSSTLMFVQDADRLSGIRVTAGSGSIPSISVGTACTVMGRLTTVDNVRQITDVTVLAGSPGPPPGPLGIVGKYVGGSDFEYSPGPPAVGQKGAPWACGPNSVGLLIKVSGTVLDGPAGGVFHISDGSMASGLPVKLYGSVSAPDTGSFVLITGIAEPDGVVVVSQDDVQVL